jgi:hypothetical protein
MGGVFNYVNLHAYHYAGNNPVRYIDPDGKQAGPPPNQQPNNLSPINTPYTREPAYQNMMTRHERAEAVAEAMGIGANGLGVIIDKVFLGGKYEKTANKFSIKVMLTFIKVKTDLKYSNLFDFDRNGEYSDREIDAYVEVVNNTMTMNFTDQKSLGPYAGSVSIPRIRRYEAEQLLKGQPSSSTTE